VFGSNRIITLDIGASKIVLAEFGTGRGGAPELFSYGTGKIDIEPDSETDSSAYVVSALREIMLEQNIRQAPLLMTVSGQTVFPRYVKLPPVTRDKVLQIVQYEAQQNVPFPIDEVVWDYQLIGKEAEGDLNVMLIAGKMEIITKFTNCVVAAGLEPEVVDVSPMALYNAVRYNYPDIEGCKMILDIGARSSNLIFIEGNRIFSRNIPVAGNAITHELMKEFRVPFKEAEELKIAKTFVAFGGAYAGAEDKIADRASKIVRNVVTRLHAEVNRSINFYRSQQGGSPPSLVLLTGGSSVIPHVDTFFEEKLKAEVGHLNPFINVAVSDQIDGDRISGDLHLLGEVVGLALRRSLTCPVEINLMPAELVAKKIFRRRRPFFVLAAVGLVLTMLCWWVYFHHMQAMMRTRMEKVAWKTADVNTVSDSLEEVKNRKKEVQKKTDILVGAVALRAQWLEMLDAIHSCMLDGMWLTSLQPIIEDGMITHIEISGRGFVDKLVDKPDTTAIEEFRNRMEVSDYFTEGSKITKLPVVSSKDFAREFSIWAALKKPVEVR